MANLDDARVATDGATRTGDATNRNTTVRDTTVRDTASGETAAQTPLMVAGLAALGVVFGDIGTSPLYTFKAVLALAGGKPSPEIVLGSLSLIIWTLVIITTLKYVSIAMRIDNDGEGGILALMSLIGVKRDNRPLIVAAGLFGAALIYGDGAITPAISVLSALEGLEIATPAFKPYIVPLAVTILAAIFVIQPFGTARIGRLFGPVMATWFAVIAILGLGGLVQHPGVLAAIDPGYALSYLATSGWTGFLVLGGVFLCVTGAEALYADMGQFGVPPIRATWLGIVFPSLVLSYAGQAAYVLEHGSSDDNVFYQLCPSLLLMPLVALSTVATIIASQSIITGSFSMTRQAIRLGWMPRMKITQTAEESYGQIYVGAVNWLLMLVTIGLTIGFQKSDNLASAYGIAVSATMLITTVLLYIAMRVIWHWSAVAAGLVAGALMVVDATFMAANATKILQGGYVPLVLAGLVYGIMYIWHRGQDAVMARIAEHKLPLDGFLAGLPAAGVARVSGTALFLTREKDNTPGVIAWYVDHAHALQEHIVALTIETETRPWVAESERATVREAAPGFWRVTAHYGFLERPNISRLLQSLSERGCSVDAANVTCFVGRDSIVPREDGRGMPHLFVGIYGWFVRNSPHIEEALNFPRGCVVEIGRRIDI